MLSFFLGDLSPIFLLTGRAEEGGQDVSCKVHQDVIDCDYDPPSSHVLRLKQEELGHDTAPGQFCCLYLRWWKGIPCGKTAKAEVPTWDTSSTEEHLEVFSS